MASLWLWAHMTHVYMLHLNCPLQPRQHTIENFKTKFQIYVGFMASYLEKNSELLVVWHVGDPCSMWTLWKYHSLIPQRSTHSLYPECTFVMSQLNTYHSRTFLKPFTQNSSKSPIYPLLSSAIPIKQRDGALMESVCLKTKPLFSFQEQYRFCYDLAQEYLDCLEVR